MTRIGNTGDWRMEGGEERVKVRRVESDSRARLRRRYQEEVGMLNARGWGYR